MKHIFVILDQTVWGFVAPRDDLMVNDFGFLVLIKMVKRPSLFPEYTIGVGATLGSKTYLS